MVGTKRSAFFCQVQHLADEEYVTVDKKQISQLMARVKMRIGDIPPLLERIKVLEDIQ